MRTLWLLYELEVEFEVVLHAFDRSLRDPEYLTLSPAGRVPALEIDGERMFETGAITEYLCERFPEANMGRSASDPDRMAWLVWVHFAETISQHAAALTQQHIMLFEDAMRSPIVMKLEAARLGKCYDALEARLSTPVENRDYLLTSGFSACRCVGGTGGLHGAAFPAAGRSSGGGRLVRADHRATGVSKSLPDGEGAQLYARDFYPAWETGG